MGRIYQIHKKISRYQLDDIQELMSNSYLRRNSMPGYELSEDKWLVIAKNLSLEVAIEWACCFQKSQDRIETNWINHRLMTHDDVTRHTASYRIHDPVSKMNHPAQLFV